MMKTIFQINVKPKTLNEHGIPKTSVKSVYVSKLGLEGDYNNFRTIKKDKNPDMAVLVYPIETIHELNNEGWPIMPGDLGENFTTSGIPHSHLSLNQKYKIGECIIEISFECDPCKNLSVLPYIGETKINDFIKKLMHRRGWYARVLKEGVVTQNSVIEQIS
ncbi:MAG: MOSC domain-containing protein [Candidatus Marinimicrobia bacterium]|jgi:MOSC domain-containing protein YiiM|nr:MOSC domain-containing protein [Candidatus Neomarinimicrobiota bacterium]MBT7358219.1 MOSC domain-containing protein [Candidatus Neomarinimicrobiota bacterium]MBT7512974.1 MOSC domain-containing protein [Candidatus Neomarinimicrobiota bacterium]